MKSQATFRNTERGEREAMRTQDRVSVAVRVSLKQPSTRGLPIDHSHIAVLPNCWEWGG